MRHLGNTSKHRLLTEAELATAGIRVDEPAVSSRREERPRATKPAVSERLGPHLIAENNARHRVEWLQKDLHDDEGPAGPACFGPRIRQEQFPKGFTLP